MKERSVNFFGEKNQTNICNVFVMVEKIFTYILLLLIQLPYHHFPTNYYLLIPITLKTVGKNKKMYMALFPRCYSFWWKTSSKILKHCPRGMLLKPFWYHLKTESGMVSCLPFWISFEPPAQRHWPPSPRKNIRFCLGKVAVCLIVILLMASFFLLNLFFIIPMLIMWFREHE